MGVGVWGFYTAMCYDVRRYSRAIGGVFKWGGVMLSGEEKLVGIDAGSCSGSFPVWRERHKCREEGTGGEKRIGGVEIEIEIGG